MPKLETPVQNTSADQLTEVLSWQGLTDDQLVLAVWLMRKNDGKPFVMPKLTLDEITEAMRHYRPLETLERDLARLYRMAIVNRIAGRFSFNGTVSDWPEARPLKSVGGVR